MHSAKIKSGNGLILISDTVSTLYNQLYNRLDELCK